jgi:FAD/FMN-containing dehydrogenase
VKRLLVRELEQLLRGEVFDSADVLDYFSTDGSVFALRPQAVVYPRAASDIQRVMHYATTQAEKGNPIGVTARGKGTDQAGGALGDGIMLVMPAHMKRFIDSDKKRNVTVQPGLIYRDLQNTLHSHGRFLPPYPSSIDYSTIGGAVANNACGEKTIKYGATRDYVRKLEVVLANGDLIEARRLSARELNRKKGQTNFEGEIYRKLDNLLRKNVEIIKHQQPNTSKNAAGYALNRVRGRNGSFDLSQLFVGSQGTLGIVTEIDLRTQPLNSRTSLVVGYFDEIEAAGRAIMKLQKLGPSALEIVDYYLLNFLRENRPAMIAGLIPDELPKIVLLAEFDDQSQLKQTLRSRRAEAIMNGLGAACRIATKQREQDNLWQIRRSAAAVIWMTHGKKKALPVIEDGVVPIEKLPEFLESVYKLLKKHKLEIAVWGHAGNANFHMQPWLDLSNTGDRTKLFDLADDFYNMVIKLGGSTCGEHNDGLMRAPYLRKLYGDEMYELFREVKRIFDPHNILNPSVKIDVTQDKIKPLLRHEYSMQHLYDHLPQN